MATIYQLSVRNSAWCIERLGDEMSILHEGIASEHDAMTIAITRAKDEGNVHIVRTDPAGNREVIARFGDLKSHAAPPN
jgi:hypothetical protein